MEDAQSDPDRARIYPPFAASSGLNVSFDIDYGNNNTERSSGCYSSLDNYNAFKSNYGEMATMILKLIEKQKKNL